MAYKIYKPKPKKPKEKPITNQVLEYLNSLPYSKFIKRHQTRFSHAGEPDVEGSYRGHHVEIECKAPGNRPTKLQIQRLEEWNLVGAYAIWTDNLDDVRRLVMTIDYEKL